jgi:hypothetical protein
LRFGVTKEVPNPNLITSECGPPTLMKLCTSLILKPLSMIMVKPDFLGCEVRTGICDKLKFIVLILTKMQK